MDHDVAFTDLEVCAPCAWLRVSFAAVAQGSGDVCLSCFETRARIFRSTKFVKLSYESECGVQACCRLCTGRVRGRASLDACLS